MTVRIPLKGVNHFTAYTSALPVVAQRERDLGAASRGAQADTYDHVKRGGRAQTDGQL